MVTALATAGVGLLASRSSSKASKAAQKGQEQAQGINAATAAKASGDVNRLFGSARDSRRGGLSNAADFIGGNIGRQLSPFIQSNVGAQEQIGRGLNAQQAAILGLAPDLSGFGARSFGDPNQFNIDNPFAQQQQAPQPQPFQLNPQQSISIQDGLNNFRGFNGSGLNRFSNFNFQGSM